MSAEFVGARKLGEIVGQPQDLHDGQVSPDGDSRPAGLQGTQGHGRHARSLGDLFGGQLAAQARKLEPLTKFDEELAGSWQERGGLLCHG
ncbi:hypothetical protein APT56_25180 [Achromobacter denitrificans]|nr:hypothetical protein APT56_25180 [Achromobacter denitrificans]